MLKKCFLKKKKTDYLTSTYKSGSLKGKLSKMTIYIYKRVYFILKSTASYT